MYLWVVIATFIAILYSFNLAVRPDFDRAYAESKASVVITKFRAQHNAVKDYFNSKDPDKIEETFVPYYPGDGINCSGCDDDIKNEIENYLPVGFDPDPETISKVYCFESDNPVAQCVTGDGFPSCCSNEYHVAYVVSYRQIPSRWINKVTKMPNADLLGSMAKTTGYGKSFGYTDIIDDKLVLSGGHLYQEYDEHGNAQGDKKFEYQEIFKAVQDDPDFKKCKGEKVHCLYAFQQVYSVGERND